MIGNIRALSIVMRFMRFVMSILFCNYIDGEERAGCLTLFVFLVSRNCCVALPRNATGLSAVRDCGIS